MDKLISALFAFLLSICSFCVSAKIQIPIYLSSEPSTSIGSIVVEDSSYGLLIKPDLNNLSPGVHGFHIHEHPSCADHAKAAGGHLDPMHTDKHLGPYNANGHLGDMPALVVDNKGKATLPLLAPRLKEADIKGHTVMVHVGGDNYSDSPEKLGGGGARYACGVVK